MSKNMQYGEFCWNELMTPDLEKAKKFYQDLLGWKFEEHPVGDIKYTMIKGEDKDGGGGMMQIPEDKEGKIPPHWMSYIFVEDVEKSAEKAKQLGAKITMQVTDVGDFGRFVVLEDPTGAHIALWQSLKSC